jgi:hypothetical protein
MDLTDRILETITEIAQRRKCSEHDISWHSIASELAQKLNNIENNKSETKAEDLTKGSTLLATLNKENFPCGSHQDLIDELHEIVDKALNTRK